MTQSKISISNLALSMLGSDPIRSFNEDNKRARMCQVQFEFQSEYLLTKFDWAFARRFVLLTEATGSSLPDSLPEGWTAYHLPNDCLNPRDIHPRGHKEQWYQADTLIFIETTSISGPYLWYTYNHTIVAQYSRTFVNLLALRMAIFMCIPITQSKTLAASLRDAYKMAMPDDISTDANIGNIHKHTDDRYDEDSFNWPEGIIDDADNPGAAK
jgi:hypothetical protein